MNKVYKTAIVGGGASGLMCAIELLSGNNRLHSDEIVVIERNDRVGKKLLATGNGQGNLSNVDMSLSHFYGDVDFIKSFFNSSDFSLQSYLRSIGIYLTQSQDGKLYPISKQASSVLDIMRSFLIKSGCNFIYNNKIEKIEKKESVFLLYGNGGCVFANNVVMACGGKSGKQFGTDGTSYSLVKKFGHIITDLYPSLVQLKTDTLTIKGLRGIKEYVKLTLYDGDRAIKTYQGDLLFTEYGVSGDAVFKISASIYGVKNPILKIEFLPNFNKEQLSEILSDKLKLSHVNKGELLCGILNKKVGEAILKISKDNVDDIVNSVKDFRLKIIGTLGFDYSQVTKGGIVTKDVSPFTLESKLVSGLYLTGEMLDVDGDCGGYNLTFAFMSGIKSAKHIKEKLKVE